MQAGKAKKERYERKRSFLSAKLALVLLACALALSSCGNGGRIGQASGTDGAGHPSLGDEYAPVVMVEYADFRCPFCGKFAREVQPGLVEKYVEDGTLRMEWRDFPYLGRESINAALAARAAQEQGMFWEYHDLLFEHQGPRDGTPSDENLFALAEEAGLDARRFEKGLTGGTHESAITEDFLEGQKRGVTGTPTFYINDEVLVGTQPAEAFEEAIERAAREAGDGW